MVSLFCTTSLMFAKRRAGVKRREDILLLADTKNLLSDGKRLAGNVIVGQEEEHASCCGVMRSRRNRERKRRRKGLRLESGGHETAGGEGKKAKSAQTDASTGRPKEAGAASAFPLGRGNLREVFLLAHRQLGKGRIGRGMGNGR